MKCKTYALYPNLSFYRPYTYKDTVTNCNSQEIASRVSSLKSDISKLEQYETVLDLHKLLIEQSIRNITEDIDNKKYMYVTHDDFAKCFSPDEHVLVINSPLNSCIQVEV